MDKIKESIERGNDIVGNLADYRDRLAVKTLVDIAKRVDSAEMPQKEKIKRFETVEDMKKDDGIDDVFNMGRNKGIDEFKLYLAKREVL